MSSLFPSSGPTLPQFQSLLITGAYYPSAPVHFLLSHAAQDLSRRAIMFVPSRQAAAENMQDQWLNVNGGTGGVCQRSSQVDIFYPPTPAHLVLLMTMMHTFDGTVRHLKTTLEVSPSILVFYELSLYFSTGQHTLSSYLSLVSHALQLTKRLSGKSDELVKCVIFDSGLNDLRLPILRPVSTSGEETENTQGSQSRSAGESAHPIVEKYFEWVGIAKVVSPNTTNTRTIKSLTLYQRGGPPGDER